MIRFRAEETKEHNQIRLGSVFQSVLQVVISKS